MVFEGSYCESNVLLKLERSLGMWVLGSVARLITIIGQPVDATVSEAELQQHLGSRDSLVLAADCMHLRRARMLDR
jgi:hypothetical protein